MVYLNDSYYQLFRDRVKVDEAHLELTFNKPKRIQSLNNDVTLYLGVFNDAHYKYLLACTMLSEGVEGFSFCFWLPDSIINDDVELLEVLRVFANQFGVLLKIGDEEGFFFEHKQRMLVNYIQSPFEVAELLCPSIIPVDLFVFYNQSIAGALNTVECYYCFAVNYNKYLNWLYQLKTVGINIPAVHLDFFKEIVSTLNPVQRTTLLIKDPFNIATKEEVVSVENVIEDIKEAVVDVPEKYVKVVSYINEKVRTLNEGQKMIVVPFDKDFKCVFCDNEVLTDEHIIPQWSRGFFERKSFDSITMTREDGEDLLLSLTSGVSKGKWDSHGITVNNVCATCNNEWLSSLEVNIKALLVKDGKLLNELVIDQLNEEDRRQLARWVIIKGLLLTNKSRLPTYFKQNLFHKLKADDIPEQLLVEVTSFDNYNLNYHIAIGASAIASRFRLDKYDIKIAKKYDKEYYQFCFQFGNIVFRVSYWDDSIGLIREGSMKPTSVLYPLNFKLGYFKSDEADNVFNKTDDELKLYIFANSISLTDFNLHS